MPGEAVHLWLQRKRKQALAHMEPGPITDGNKKVAERNFCRHSSCLGLTGFGRILISHVWDTDVKWDLIVQPIHPIHFLRAGTTLQIC